MKLTEGEGIRGAMRWLSERRQEDPRSSRLALIDEAARRFDLTPIEAEFLITNWREGEAPTKAA